MNGDPLFDKLCRACKIGDLSKVKKYVEQGTAINQPDDFDCTPLYYASLCGHFAVAEYLLKSGATCDPNTFQGERCVYGALTDKIRNLLRKHDLSKTIHEQADYSIFLYKLFNNGQGLGADFEIKFGSSSFHVHSWILMCRSRYFLDQFLGRWRLKRSASIKHELITPSILSATLLYLYTGQVTRLDKEEWDDWQFVAKLWKLDHLQNIIEKMKAPKSLHWKTLGTTQKDTVLLFQDMQKLFELTTQEPEHIRCDILIQLQDQTIQCHRELLKRSPFLAGLLSFHPQETHSISLDIEAATFKNILEYIYTVACINPG